MPHYLKQTALYPVKMSQVKILCGCSFVVLHIPCAACSIDRKQNLTFAIYERSAGTPADIPKVTFADLQLCTDEGCRNDDRRNAYVHPLTQCRSRDDYLRWVFSDEFF